MGKVQRITDFGAFVEIMPGTDGLLHVSEIAHYRVKDVRDELKEGEQVMVKVINIDPSGKIRLSRKGAAPARRGPGQGRNRQGLRRSSLGQDRRRAEPSSAGPASESVARLELAQFLCERTRLGGKAPPGHNEAL